jgi:hypothetical protein
MSDLDSTKLYELINECNKEIDRIVAEKENFIKEQQRHQRKIDNNLQNIITYLKKLEDDNDLEG